MRFFPVSIFGSGSTRRVEKLPHYISAKMKPEFIRIDGLMMVPVCILGLLCRQSFIWLVCPQVLVVMFIRQAQHGHDSLGAAGYPDLAVALLYYPLIGWILSRAGKAGKLRPVAIRVMVWHVAFMGLAVLAGEMRNRIWGFGR